MNRSVFKFGEFSGSDCLEFRKGNANAGRKFLLKSGSAFLLDGMGDHSHSLRLNALCVIYVYLIPSGDSDSLRHSYSTACTASGYHFVISAITGETVLL